MSVGVAVLGSTGSIGRATLEVLARHRDRFHVVALTAASSADLLAEQALRWRPAYTALANGAGARCLVEAATRPDAGVVVNAIVGAAGLEATIAALRAGKRVALANKEPLVMAGEVVLRAAREGAGEIVPIDSEHSAVLQCIAGRRTEEIARLILTASGGPFRNWPPERAAAATVAEALNHPTWRMGPKITVDSATLMNKGFEVIEAHHLFGVPYERIEVVVHPQSIVHAVVDLNDGASLAHLGHPLLGDRAYGGPLGAIRRPARHAGKRPAFRSDCRLAPNRGCARRRRPGAQSRSARTRDTGCGAAAGRCRACSGPSETQFGVDAFDIAIPLIGEFVEH